MMLHVGRHVSTATIWTTWTLEPGSVGAIAASTAVYLRGVHTSWRRAGAGRGIQRWQLGVFAMGIGAVILALLSPLDALAEELFAAHMTQHVLLAIVAPPLLVLGAPQLATIWAIPPAARARTARFFNRARKHAWWRTLTAAPTAALLNAAVLWAWHVPGPYETALVHPAVHALEHATLLGAGVLLWWSILHGRRSRRASYGIGIGTLFFTMLHGTALGALIALSRHPWYPLQSHGAAAWGLTPLADQQMAGLIMWVVAGFLELIAASTLFLAWMHVSASSTRRSVAAAAAALTFTACARAEQSPVPGGSVERGRQSLAAMGCGSCHTIAGVSGAHGLVGPPLTGIASRSIIAGQLANTPANMMRWIADPPSIEPHTAMPNLHVGAQSARDITAYLYTLR